MPGADYRDEDRVHIPDAGFAEYCLTHFDANKDGVLVRREIASVTNIDVTNKKIKSLQGIEFFSSLTTLNCSHNDIASLDLSRNSRLTSLNCLSNRLTSLDLSDNTELTHLHCCFNRLSSLDMSHNQNLQSLICSNNLLATLDVSQNVMLQELNCEANQLTSLDVSNTSIGNSAYKNPLSCAQMETLETLWLKTGWHINGVTESNNRSIEFIPEQTVIEYVD